MVRYSIHNSKQPNFNINGDALGQLSFIFIWYKGTTKDNWMFFCGHKLLPPYGLDCKIHISIETQWTSFYFWTKYSDKNCQSLYNNKKKDTSEQWFFYQYVFHRGEITRHVKLLMDISKCSTQNYFNIYCKKKQPWSTKIHIKCVAGLNP